MIAPGVDAVRLRAAISAEPDNVPWVTTIGCTGGRDGREIPDMQSSSGRERKPPVFA